MISNKSLCLNKKFQRNSSQYGRMLVSFWTGAPSLLICNINNESRLNAALLNFVKDLSWSMAVFLQAENKLQETLVANKIYFS